jgi:hypothetical protein
MGIHGIKFTLRRVSITPVLMGIFDLDTLKQQLQLGAIEPLFLTAQGVIPEPPGLEPFVTHLGMQTMASLIHALCG